MATNVLIPIGPSLEERLTFATQQLRLLEHLIREYGSQGDNVTAALSSEDTLALSDWLIVIRATLKPLHNAPAAVLNWEPTPQTDTEGVR